MVLVTPGDDLSIYPERISVYDSLVINFDTVAKTIHYGAVTGMNPLALPFPNNRNIFNKINWEKKIITDKRKRQESEYTFTLTMQDYLDVKSNKYSLFSSK